MIVPILPFRYTINIILVLLIRNHHVISKWELQIKIKFSKSEIPKTLKIISMLFYVLVRKMGLFFFKPSYFQIAAYCQNKKFCERRHHNHGLF